MEPHSSSSETFETEWTRVKGQARQWWDRLTESDLEQVSGEKDRLIRLVQEKYGYARERAEQEIDQHLREHRDIGQGSAAGSSREEASTRMGDYAAGVAASAGEVGAKVQNMASSATTSMASTVSGAGTYLQDLPTEFAGLVRRHPIPSLLIGIGVGFLLGRSLGQMSMTSQDSGDWQTEAQRRETGYPDAMIQCVRCGELVRQRDMVSHSTMCSGTGTTGHGGSPA
jgi:uncharacterized protein YjbJ (UPF0337 family)/ElaB/YqjD/DUF883 family membrane-anchored ribosome-binding protein